MCGWSWIALGRERWRGMVAGVAQVWIVWVNASRCYVRVTESVRDCGGAGVDDALDTDWMLGTCGTHESSGCRPHVQCKR